MPHGTGKGNVNIASGATLSLDFNNTINGLNDLGGGGGTVLTQDASSVVLTVGDGDADGDFSGTIVSTTAGSTVGFAKIGTGTQVLSGTNTYNGTTAVNGGTLIVNGSHTSVAGFSVATGATLGGTGSIQSSVALNVKIAPGESAGTLTIGGLSLNDGVSFDIELDPNDTSVGGPNDLIDVMGTLNLTAVTDPTTITLNLEDVDTNSDFGGIGTWTLMTFDSINPVFTGSLPINIMGLASGVTGAVSVNGDGTVTLTTVPEPGSLILITFGLIGIGAIVRQRRK
jgi:autotransporter-associated beta strand protein